ncbi:MAG: hypothetical protein ABIK28_12920 [Planctomycetota bacterium]
MKWHKIEMICSSRCTLLLPPESWQHENDGYVYYLSKYPGWREPLITTLFTNVDGSFDTANDHIYLLDEDKNRVIDRDEPFVATAQEWHANGYRTNQPLFHPSFISPFAFQAKSFNAYLIRGKRVVCGSWIRPS